MFIAQIINIITPTEFRIKYYTEIINGRNRFNYVSSIFNGAGKVRQRVTFAL